MIPGRECKISAKLARFERFDIVYSNDWRSVCHFDVAYTGPGPLSCKTATQISNPRFDCHSSRNGDGDCGLAGREIESSRIDVSSRTPPMQMHRSSLFFLFSSSPFLFSMPSHSRFISFSVDHSIFSFLTTFSVGESYPCLSTHTPLSLSTAQKVVKRKKKGRSMFEQVTRTLTTDAVRGSCWRYE